MNILIVTATYSPSSNGVAVSTKRTVDELKKQGHKVFVMAPKFKERKEKLDIEIPSVINPLYKDYPLLMPIPTRSMTKFLASQSVDIVHVHHPIYVGQIGQLFGKIKKAKLVFTYHTRYGEVVRKFLEDNFPIIPNEKIADLVEGRVTSFANRCDAVIATTKTFEKELKKRYKSPVYYNSTAGLTKTMKLNENKKVVRKRLNLPADKTILLNVSRQAVEKNLELLIETYAKLNKSKYHLVLVGSGPHTKNLKNFAKKLKIYKSITFPGRKLQEELPEFYSASDIFLYSSNTDTIGINILEAMSAGLPVIAVKDPSTAEVVKHNKNGFLVQAQTLDFVKSINKLNNSKKGYQIMATNAIKTAEKFKVEGTTTGLVSIYKKIVSG